MKNKLVRISALISFSFLVLLFQNCSNKSFDSSDLSSASLKAENDSSGEVDYRSSNAGSNNAANLRVYDSSVGDGNIVTQLVQKISGGGAGLRGCTGPMSMYSTGCLKDSDYILITQAWGANSYDAATDIYSTNQNVAASAWPFTAYFTRYILADGSRTEVTFSPTVKISIKLPRLQWVRISSQACFGPTPPPAPEGQPCSIENDSRTNGCGTAVCKFSTNY